MRFGATAALVTWLALGGGCRRGPAPQQSFVTRLAAASHGLDGEGKIVVRDITEFEWDQLFAFGPYTTLQSAQELMKLTELPQALAKTKVDTRDDISVFVFLRQAAVSRVFPISRAQVDVPQGKVGPLGPAEALLQRGTSGGQLVLLTPAANGPPP